MELAAVNYNRTTTKRAAGNTGDNYRRKWPADNGL
jgi:hypothetical protein